MPRSSASYSLVALAAHIDARLQGEPNVTIHGLATLQEARAGELSFLANPVYKKYLATSGASAVILHPKDADSFGGNALVHTNPYLAYARLTELFVPKFESADSGIHPSAVVATDVEIGSNAVIGPHAVIEAGACIGSGVVIGAGSYVGADVCIGANTRLYPNVTLYHGVRLGARCIIHARVTIGSDGFGFAPDHGRWVKIHQLGGVTIGDDVELGTGTCVDRGALADTWIGDGVKTDNMVQIAHNVRIGSNTVIAGCTAIAGSTIIGANCMIAGGVGIVGHVTIADGVTITAMSLVTKSIPQPGSYSSGTPLEATALWRKNAVRFGQLDDINRRLKKLEATQAPARNDSENTNE